MSDHRFDVRLKALDHLQSVIQRLAGNSFLIKGWAVTLSSALLGLSVKGTNSAAVAYLAILPTVVFWLLDAYYLALEREFRDKYAAAMATDELPSFNLVVSRITIDRLRKAALAPATLLPYLALFVCEVIFGVGLL